MDIINRHNLLIWGDSSLDKYKKIAELYNAEWYETKNDKKILACFPSKKYLEAFISSVKIFEDVNYQLLKTESEIKYQTL